MTERKNRGKIAVIGFILIIAALKLNPFSQRAITSMNMLSQYGYQDLYNLVPLNTIGEYIVNYSSYNLSIIVNFFLVNLLLFVPIGALLSKTDLDLSKKILILAVTPVVFEFLQTIFRIGVFDIDAILLNIVGGLLAFKIANLKYPATKETI